jgi:2-hydroxychromene-2-carboxylate isomerase
LKILSNSEIAEISNGNNTVLLNCTLSDNSKLGVDDIQLHRSSVSPRVMPDIGSQPESTENSAQLTTNLARRVYMAIDASKDPVRFLFDPLCPWAWRTSLWIRNVRDQGAVDVEWRLYSLEYVNRADTNNPYLPMLKKARLALRLLELVRLTGGNDAIDRLYLALGRALHERNEDLTDQATLRAAAEEVGIDPVLIDRAVSERKLDQELNAQYEAAEKSGAFAVPTLFVTSQEKPFFGPVISTVPEGAEALEIWNDVLALTNKPYFFELKRSR